MSGNWVAVASAEHVRVGRRQGFMQVCHGKAAPLKRIRPGDAVVYYSPTEIFGGKDKLQSFTAIGVVKDGVPYQADIGGGFCPFRRDVDWRMAEAAPIKPLLGASNSRRPGATGVFSCASDCSRFPHTTSR
jgi:hypothetical protein